MPNKMLQKVIKNLLFLFAGLALLYLAFRGQDISTLIFDLQNANYLYVSLAVLIGLLAYISRGIRWLILLEPMGYKPKLHNSVYTIIVGYFANLAVPRIGELTRCTTMSRAENIPVDKLFGTVILERIIDVLMLLGLTIITVLINIDVFGNFFINLIYSNMERFPGLFRIVSIFTIVLIAIVIIFLAIRSRFSNLLIYRKVKFFVLGIREGLISIRQIKKIKSFVFHTLLIWFCYYTMTWVVFFALEETSHLNLIDGLFIMVVGGFGMAAPVQGGIGAYHLIVSLGLAVLGVAKAPALSYATIVHTSQVLFMLFAGSVSLIMLYLGSRKSATNSPTGL